MLMISFEQAQVRIVFFSIRATLAIGEMDHEQASQQCQSGSLPRRQSGPVHALVL
jgi:hypothetical protein